MNAFSQMMNIKNRLVAQTFLHILVCGFAGHFCPVFLAAANWRLEAARTRRLESLRCVALRQLLRRRPSRHHL
jgi:hypothetical protein